MGSIVMVTRYLLLVDWLFVTGELIICYWWIGYLFLLIDRFVENQFTNNQSTSN